MLPLFTLISDWLHRVEPLLPSVSQQFPAVASPHKAAVTFCFLAFKYCLLSTFFFLLTHFFFYLFTKLNKIQKSLARHLCEIERRR